MFRTLRALQFENRLLQSKWAIGLGILVLALCVRCANSPQTYASLKPETHYTGSESCVGCHQEIHQSYRKTNMGHSMYRPSLSDTIEYFGTEVQVYDSQLDMYYFPYWSGNKFFIREFRIEGNDTIYKRDEQVDYVIGSGNQTRSYLMQREGYLFEMPITWYVHKRIWDLSPGYAENNARFSREIGSECMSCHTGVFDYVEGSKNRYRKLSLGIGCENCHGPGAEHVKLRQAGKGPAEGEVDYSIVNPKDLPVQVQFDICSRCHLEGVSVAKGPEYRPGMPLADAMEVFVVQNKNEADIGIASHAERLVQARCFIASNGKMTCTTCHDAHSKPSSADYFVQQCQSCHQVEQAGMCASPESQHLSAEQNCVTCHMPVRGTVDIPHVRFHDHNIRVVERDTEKADWDSTRLAEWLELKCGTSADPGEDFFGRAWLLYFEQQIDNPAFLIRADEQLAMDNYVARARLYVYQGKIAEADQAVSDALLQYPDDPELRFLAGEVQENLGKFSEAAQTYGALYHENPENIEAGQKYGVNLLKSRQGDPRVLVEANRVFEELLAKKPFDTRLLVNRGFVALNQRDFRAAERCFVKALRLDPDDINALENMILLQIAKGNRVLGDTYLEALKKIEGTADRVKRLEEMW